MPAESDMRKSGSITIFMILSLTMAMSLVFTMTEVVRYFCMKSTAEALACSAAQSGLGDYNRLLYEKYGILAVDTGYGSHLANEKKLVERMTSYAASGGDPSHEKGLITYVNLCRMTPEDTGIDDVSFLTDHNGAGLIKEAAIQEVYDIPLSLLEKWEAAGKAAKETTALCDVSDGILSAAVSKSEHEVYVTGASHISHETCGDDRGESIIDAVSEFKKRGVLYQVMGSEMDLSTKRLVIEDRVSKRALNKGSGDEIAVTVSDRLMYKLYLLEHFSCYTDPKERMAASYELEYIVSGHLTDEENLRSVVKKLLALREAENMAALFKDNARRSEAEGLAAAAAAAALNPELEPLFTAALMAVWAYVESVLDVRLLLSGGSVPLVKSPDEWTSELYTLPECLDTSVKARDVQTGIDYKGYLFALMTVTSEKKLGLRPMDLMEDELHKRSDYTDVRMDNMLVKGRYKVTMTGTPLFLSLAPLVSTKLGKYEFKEDPVLSYL